MEGDGGKCEWIGRDGRSRRGGRKMKGAWREGAESDRRTRQRLSVAGRGREGTGADVSEWEGKRLDGEADKATGVKVRRRKLS